jgi:3-phenylpropionate/trans-cinnamate dioxygenase ferredoxin component
VGRERRDDGGVGRLGCVTIGDKEPGAANAPGLRRVDLVGADDVPDGTMQLLWVDGTDPVLIVNLGGDFHAYQGICSHEYFELDKGFLNTEGAGDSKGPTLTCALHLSRFDLTDGYPLDPPAEDALAIYPVVVEAGRVMIEVPDGPLEVNG